MVYGKQKPHVISQQLPYGLKQLGLCDSMVLQTACQCWQRTYGEKEKQCFKSGSCMHEIQCMSKTKKD